MPKRWKVLLSGQARADMSSAESDDVGDAVNLRDSVAEVEADTLEVSGAALVFAEDDSVKCVFSPDSYWVAVRVDDDEARAGGDVPNAP